MRRANALSVNVGNLNYDDIKTDDVLVTQDYDIR